MAERPSAPVFKNCSLRFDASGDAVGAEVSYREDLAKHKENAWSLLGLSQALDRQGKHKEHSSRQARVKAAWDRADIKAPASCYCGVALK
jgi:hypothetical protein